MTFTIFRLADSGPFAIRTADYTIDGLAFDEALGWIADAMVLSAIPPARRWEAESFIEAEWSLRVTKTDERYWLAEHGSRFIDHLERHEMLGFLAVYLWTNGSECVFGGLKTYEQAVSHYCWLRKPPVALLGVVA